MLNFFKPTPRVTGAACSFSGNTMEGSLFISMIKQASWDDQRKVGSFKANKESAEHNINLKFNLNEVAAILDCIDRNRPFNTYHTSKDQKTGIKFQPYMRDIEGKSTQVGFSLALMRDVNGTKSNFTIGFSFGEARHLREFLIAFTQSYYSRVFIEQEKRYGAKASKQAVPTEQEAPEMEVPADDTTI